MNDRQSSPAVSENEVDIAGALFHNGSDESSEEPGTAKRSKKESHGLDRILDIAEDGSDGDAGFIASSLVNANRKTSNLKGKTVKKGGGFQAMGLNTNLLKAITRKGFSVPTPIQRKTIPMVLDGKDVVGMARTGSGKTAAFVIPMIEKLKSHSTKVGARGLIMSPSRELALQTLKVVKEMGRGTDLKSVLLVGGDSLEEQFNFMATNPDIIICTPGRFLHLKVEMGLDLSSIRYAVFDEADRLFEMGFAAQLTEILHALPQSRQTLLFSATLPKSLVEFARAGLQDPNLVRLDAESKVSPDLQSAHFTLKSQDKEGALLHVLSDIIKVPTGLTEAALQTENKFPNGAGSKRKRDHKEVRPVKKSPTAHSTIVFVATKHHVEYLATLLRHSGFAVSHAYGSLDQTARKMQVEDFRNGLTNILVVTDVAARGIDIPILANVINYDFPPQPKIFVHRVGRTARAGEQGWAYSLVRPSDAPYLLDLQLFLSRRLVLGGDASENVSYANDVVIGALVRDRMETSSEFVSKLLDDDSDLQALRSVAIKGEKLYLRTRHSASSESARRAKDLSSSTSWSAVHPLFRDEATNDESARIQMLAQVSGFRPAETVFEVGKKGQANETVEIIKKRRATIMSKRTRDDIRAESSEQSTHKTKAMGKTNAGALPTPDLSPDLDDLDMAMDSASDTELQITFPDKSTGKGTDDKSDFRSSEFFMSYNPTDTNLVEDRAYGVHSGGNSKGNFVTAARGATMDLNNDDGGSKAGPGEPSRMRWDKKGRKYVNTANDQDGSKGAKFIRGESGQKIAASFRSGRFEAWKKKSRIGKMPRIGETESSVGPLSQQHQAASGKHYKHKSDKAPKDADKYRDDYYKKKKMVESAKEARRGRFRDGTDARGRVNGAAGTGAELKSADVVRKERREKEKRQEKNSGGKKGKKGR